MEARTVKGSLKAAIDFFSSNRLAMYLIIAVSVTSLIGVIVPQRYTSISEDVYLKKFTSGFLGILGTIGIFNIFYTWWYRTLVGLLVVNLVLCSYKRFVRLLNLKREMRIAGFEQLRELARSAERLSETASEKNILKAFARFGCSKRRQDKGGTFLFFEGGALGRFGPYIIHLAVLLVIVGGMVGNLFGIDGSIEIPEQGESSKIWLARSGSTYDLGFTIKCLDFSIDLYEGTQQPKGYKSHIQIIDDGKVVSERVIEVNAPLKYGGFTIYQASYGLLGYRAQIKAEDTQTGKIYELIAAIGDKSEIGDTGYAIALMNAEKNYQNAGPALNLVVQNPDGTSESIWIFRESPDFDRLRGGRFVFSYTGQEEIYFTGLSVARNPGLVLVWIGCVILFLGLFINFLMSHRWAAVKVEKNKIIAVYGASKYREAWQTRFDSAVAAIRKGNAS